ncbi:hypothetical protein B0H17DRAFT_1266265 [Mycena rosella]|uniref:Uncharacterized protein n=1 Tax=Mycena rosella TaxID=1033263 RepID=A0AAD7CNI0_MYCRO|nr:hypothetical protein B0H17DRAFT_1266265 [Mycena rosella]
MPGPDFAAGFLTPRSTQLTYLGIDLRAHGRCSFCGERCIFIRSVHPESIHSLLGQIDFEPNLILFYARGTAILALPCSGSYNTRDKCARGGFFGYKLLCKKEKTCHPRLGASWCWLRCDSSAIAKCGKKGLWRKNEFAACATGRTAEEVNQIVNTSREVPLFALRPREEHVNSGESPEKAVNFITPKNVTSRTRSATVRPKYYTEVSASNTLHRPIPPRGWSGIKLEREMEMSGVQASRRVYLSRDV